MEEEDGGERMDAVGFFFELLANFFPLLGSILVVGVLAAVGILVILFCMMVLVAGLYFLLDM